MGGWALQRLSRGEPGVIRTARFVNSEIAAGIDSARAKANWPATYDDPNPIRT